MEELEDAPDLMNHHHQLRNPVILLVQLDEPSHNIFFATTTTTNNNSDINIDDEHLPESILESSSESEGPPPPQPPPPPPPPVMENLEEELEDGSWENLNMRFIEIMNTLYLDPEPSSDYNESLHMFQTAETTPPPPPSWSNANAVAPATNDQAAPTATTQPQQANNVSYEQIISSEVVRFQNLVPALPPLLEPPGTACEYTSLEQIVNSACQTFNQNQSCYSASQSGSFSAGRQAESLLRAGEGQGVVDQQSEAAESVNPCGGGGATTRGGDRLVPSISECSLNQESELNPDASWVVTGVRGRRGQTNVLQTGRQNQKNSAEYDFVASSGDDDDEDKLEGAPPSASARKPPSKPKHWEWGKGKHVCSICSVNFSTRTTLKTHLSSHHGLGSLEPSPSPAFHCSNVDPSCSAYFLTKFQLRRHQELFHSSNSNKKPPQPPQVISTTTGSSEAEVTKGEGQQVVGGGGGVGWRPPGAQFGENQCSICSAKYSTMFNLRKHLKANHGVAKKSAFVCDVPRCSAYFRTKKQRTMHKARVHLGKKKKKSGAPTSPPTPPPPQELEPILEIEKIDKQRPNIPPPSAHLCKRGKNCSSIWFGSSAELELHLDTLHAKNCKTCGMKFTKPANLRRHRYGVHRKELDLRFGCGVAGCGRKFEYKEEVRWHHQHQHPNLDEIRLLTYRKLEDEDPTSQGLQGNNLKRRTTKKARARKPLRECDICGKSFNDTFKYRRHVKFHAGPDSWDYLCTYCPKKCATKQNLEAHMRSHTGDKFVCTICGAEYAAKHNLKYHMIVHTGERQSCGLCGATYSRKSGLNIHMSSKHPERMKAVEKRKRHVSRLK